MKPLARLRRVWLDVHLWIGAGLLVALMPLSVTGAILVWHDRIDHALYAVRYATSGPTASQPVEVYAEAAQAAFGTRARLTQIRLPQTPGDPVVAVGRLDGPPGPGGRPRTLNAWIDPPTARVLDTAEVARQATMVIHRLHGSLLIPDLGRKVVGWLGWAMFVSCATGLWLWWPRHGRFLVGLRWRRGASSLFNLHHMIGFWVCLPLAALSLTGVYIAFPQTSHALVGASVPPQRQGGPGRLAPPLAQPRMSLGAAIAAAGVRPQVVNYPQSGRSPSWRLESAAGATLQVVDATGEVRRALPERGGGGGPDPTSKLMRQVHDGTDMGLVWRIVITLAGLAPAGLGITGVVMWLRRSARRRAIGRAVA
ncbi:PepSY-associated TM helix domain-containing protein [Phenylobacterium sp.]|uniref:PepSY-associated TM helix domain-containing protein n=1 Tax=Phenylobacterium sp. TaxID=1871053 RepID=UPI0025F4E020|nr:PepSY-associated TM helix domain-containing protein [Phenylobacterium sp.]